jgi:methionyl-tRNA formyltransferase
MALRILFLGTPRFAVPSLEQLVAAGHTIVGVMTQPDRPRGRGRKVAAPEVKIAASAHGLTVLQPTRLKTDDSLYDTLRALQPDLGVVAAYGRLLPQRLLDLPRLGMINVHASLLPRWRGAAPVHRAILAGDRTTGVTIMRVVLALDAGPMLSKVEVEIGPDETSGELESRLAASGATLLAETVDHIAAGPVTEEPQDESLVTYAARLVREDSPLDWAQPVDAVHDQIRGLQPWPQAASWLAGRRILLRRSAVLEREAAAGEPGTILAAHGDELLVAAGVGTLRLLEVQPEGRAPMSARAYFNGQRHRAGDRFEAPTAPRQ